MLLHVHYQMSDQLNLIEIAKEFVDDKHLAGFENIKKFT